MAHYSKIGVVGLGGTGKLAVMYLKRALMERFGDAGFPATRWHVFDTDPDQPVVRTLAGVQVSLERHELTVLETKRLGELQRQAALHPQSYGYISEWWAGKTLDFPLFKAQGKGASMTGVFGRLALHSAIKNTSILDEPLNSLKAALLSPQLDQEVTEYLKAKRLETLFNGPLPNLDPAIFVIGSICGGTGRGSILDVGIDLRSRVGSAAEIHAIVFTPPFFDQHAAITAANHQPKVWANAVAALKEFEVLQRTLEATSSYVVRYDDTRSQQFPGNDRLFGQVFLLSKSNDKHELAPNDDGVAQGAELLGEWLSNMQFDAAGDFARAVSNLTDRLSTEETLVLGSWRRRAQYSALACYSISLPPMKPVADYLAYQAVSEVLRHRVLGGAPAADVDVTLLPAWVKALEGVARPEEPAGDVAELLRRTVDQRGTADSHLAAIDALDQRLNSRPRVEAAAVEGQAGDYGRFLEALAATMEGVRERPVGLAAFLEELERAEARLHHEAAIVQGVGDQLKTHVEERERAAAAALCNEGHGDPKPGTVGLRQLHRDRAARLLREAGFWWRAGFDLDADQYARAVQTVYDGFEGDFTVERSGVTVTLSKPGMADVRRCDVLAAVLAHCAEAVTSAKAEVAALKAAAAAAVDGLWRPAARRFAEAARERKTPAGMVCLPQAWLKTKILGPVVGPFGDAGFLLRQVAGSRLVKFMKGNGQEEALLGLLTDVSCQIQEHWRGRYAQIDLSRDDEFKRETGVDFAEIDHRAEPWLEIGRATGAPVLSCRERLASWAPETPADPRQFTTRDAPCRLTLSIELGLSARHLAGFPDWAMRASRTHCAAIDKRLQAMWNPDDMLLWHRLSCPNCGSDHEARRAEWVGAGCRPDQISCGDCGSYLDGSWECRGVGVAQHTPVRNSGTTAVCPTLVTVGAQPFRCRGTRPGYQAPAYCPGCLRAKGYPIDITPVPLDVDPLPGGLDVCPNGHRLTPVCPNCGVGDYLASSRHPDPRQSDKQVPVYVCGKADCVRVSGGFAWCSCPECGYPLQPPGPDEFVTCPSCVATSRACPGCPPENPFRLIKQPEAALGQPDMAQVPVCPVHGVLPKVGVS
jgi:hypothetical protein